MSYYYTWDHLGSTREMLNSSGTIVARYSYDPYGLTTLVSGTNLATFQFTDDYNHAVSQLYLTKFRAYDPDTGRWLSRDPIAENGGLNLYGYVHNKPINFYDLSGLNPKPDTFDIIFDERNHDSSAVRISYLSSCCHNIRFIQAVNGKLDYPLLPRGSDDDPYPYYPYVVHSPATGIPGQGMSTMTDGPGFMIPYVPHLFELDQNFTTCAICMDGGTPKVLKCIHWRNHIGHYGGRSDSGDQLSQPGFDASIKFSY
jgi:RHS repeat-associated protein